RRRARGLRLRAQGRHEPRPDAEACSLEDGAARKRVIGRHCAIGHGVLRLSARARCPWHGCPGALGILGHSWAAPGSARPGSARDLIRSPKTAKAAQRRAEYIPVPAKAIRRGASPRAPARSLLVVTGHRLETPTRGAVATPGLDIGRCNDDMG